MTTKFDCLKKSKLVFTASPVVLLSLSLLSNSASALMEIDPNNLNKPAIKESNKILKTRMPTTDTRRPAKYAIELNATQTVRPLGGSSVRKVKRSLGRISDPELFHPDNDSAEVKIVRPPVSSLVEVDGKLNPFSLEARYFEKVSLKDSLDAALGRNLDIQESFAKMKAQRYAFLSQASGFLPDLNSGYNLFGVNGSIPGALLGGGGGSAKLPSTLQLMNVGFTYKAYQGGKVLFGTLEHRHRYRASQAELKGDVNDILLNTTRKYYDLLLSEVLLSIRRRAVTISEEQLRLNSLQEKEGTATGLDVLQSKAQLASDEQELVDQQNARRLSAIQLAHLLNTSFAMDLASNEAVLKKRRLVPKKLSIENLIKRAVERRPELKKYEELRLAARRAIVVANAPLQPTASLSGGVYGISAQSSRVAPIYTLNMGVKWSLGSLGMKDIANVQKAKWEARQSAIKAKKAFLSVYEEVRSSYNDILSSDRRIDRASIQIDAAQEELRIAKKRMTAGIGLNIDVLNAQRDYTQASINKAKAIVDFNIAQAQLLHDIGEISTKSLLKGII